jgi:hypothetical protein
MLAEGGATVTVVDPTISPEPETSHNSKLEIEHIQYSPRADAGLNSVLALVATRRGAISSVIHIGAGADGFSRLPLVGMSDGRWETKCENEIPAAIRTTHTSRCAFANQRHRVLVISTATGSELIAPYAGPALATTNLWRLDWSHGE